VLAPRHILSLFACALFVASCSGNVKVDGAKKQESRVYSSGEQADIAFDIEIDDSAGEYSTTMQLPVEVTAANLTEAARLVSVIDLTSGMALLAQLSVTGRSFSLPARSDRYLLIVDGSNMMAQPPLGPSSTPYKFYMNARTTGAAAFLSALARQNSGLNDEIDFLSALELGQDLVAAQQSTKHTPSQAEMDQLAARFN
jgi:hypothetical protein